MLFIIQDTFKSSLLDSLENNASLIHNNITNLTSYLLNIFIKKLSLENTRLPKHVKLV